MKLSVKIPVCFPLVLVVCVLSATASPFPEKRTWRQCVRPEKCCVHPYDTPPFIACCRDQGCCPLKCPYEHSVLPPVRECQVGWECCRFRILTEEFDACCRKYGCCPRCDQVSQGCCYNGMAYGYGVVVDEVEETCAQLVCGARPSTLPPFLTAVIVVAKKPECTSLTPLCGDTCLPDTCVDDTWLVRREGESWREGECRMCRCEGGLVECEVDPPFPCPLPPHRRCVTIPGPCCPEYNCSSGCVDPDGVVREEGSEWTSPLAQCVVYFCEAGVISSKRTECEDLTSPPSPQGCVQYIPQEECCPKWNCSVCVDLQGVVREEGSEWTSPLAQCVVYFCETGVIRSRRAECEDLTSPPSHQGCVPYIPQGECCPKWNCSGCVDPDGVVREEGSEWTSPLEQCVVYFCKAGVIRSKRTECEDLTSPPSPQGCVQYIPQEECCPKWNCSVCVDPQGVVREEGSEWTSPVAQCVIYFCETGVIRSRRAECEDLTFPPSPQGCVPYIPQGECCPKWNCSGCVDPDGVVREEGSEWTSPLAQCVVYFCEAGMIRSKRTECQDLTSPPSPQGCVQYIPQGECCPKWNCSGCVDPRGIFREEGSEWTSPLAPCFPFYCEGGIIKRRQTMCKDLTSPPSSQVCVQYTHRGECCPKWNCSGCLDPHGMVREEGSEWTSPLAPCFPYYCQDGIIKKRQTVCEDLTFPPIRKDCVQYTPRGECCPKLNCSGCVDSSGQFHEEGSEWPSSVLCHVNVCEGGRVSQREVECPDIPSMPSPNCFKDTPRGECCPTWNCSGCVDSSGQFHEEGSEWPSSVLCSVDVCEGGRVNQRSAECPALPPRQSLNCFQDTPQGDCCPTWNCSGCVDKEGMFWQLGDIWQINECITLQCTDRGFHTTKEDCKLPPQPHPECQKIRSPGQCCEVWNCSITGCVDSEGENHDEGSTWPSDIPCFVYLCEAGMIAKRRVECKDLPPPPLPEGCQQIFKEGECCPIWDCRECVDEGVTRAVGEVWHPDPCTQRVCGEGGVVRESTRVCPQPPTDPTCVESQREGECCPEWICGSDGPSTLSSVNLDMCVDKKGQERKIGEEWSQDDESCLVFRCERGGFIFSFNTCA